MVRISGGIYINNTASSNSVIGSSSSISSLTHTHASARVKFIVRKYRDHLQRKQGGVSGGGQGEGEEGGGGAAAAAAAVRTIATWRRRKRTRRRRKE